MPQARSHALSTKETKAFLRESALATTSAAAFAFKDGAVGRRYAAHTHARHELLYAVSGSVTAYNN